MKSAVIKTGGKQYLVREGDELRVEKIPSVKAGDKISLKEVLLKIDDDKIDLGRPNLSAISVTATVKAEGRHPKITVIKFKPKVRQRTKNGHRQPYTTITIDKIG